MEGKAITILVKLAETADGPPEEGEISVTVMIIHTGKEGVPLGMRE